MPPVLERNIAIAWLASLILGHTSEVNRSTALGVCGSMTSQALWHITHYRNVLNCYRTTDVRVPRDITHRRPLHSHSPQQLSAVHLSHDRISPLISPKIYGHTSLRCRPLRSFTRLLLDCWSRSFRCPLLRGFRLPQYVRFERLIFQPFGLVFRQDLRRLISASACSAVVIGRTASNSFSSVSGLFEFLLARACSYISSWTQE